MKTKMLKLKYFYEYVDMIIKLASRAHNLFVGANSMYINYIRVYKTNNNACYTSIMCI